MKKVLSYSIIVVFAFIALISCENETQDKPLVLNPEMVTIGEELAISYDASQTNLAGKEEIEAVVYFWQNYNWIAHEVELDERRGLWKGKVLVPKDAAIVALKFVSGNEFDSGAQNANGANTYVQFTVDENKDNLPSSYFGWALLRAPGFERYSIPGYVSDSAKIDTKQIFFFWVNQEMKLFPEERTKVGYYAAQAIQMNNKARGNNIIKEDIDLILKQDSANAGTEEELLKAYEMANIYEPYGELPQSIEQLALSKYPNGIFARDKEILRIFRLADPMEKEKALAVFVKQYPLNEWKNVDTQNVGLYLGKNFQSVVYNQIMKNNNYQLLTDYIHEIPYDYLYSFYWHIVQIPYMRGQLSAQDVLPKAKLLLDEAFNRPRKTRELVYTDKEWYQYLLQYRKDALLEYAKILDETGSTDKAYDWVQKIEPYFENKSADFSDFYISLLDKTGNEDKIKAVVEKGVENNAASPEMLAILKANYLEENGSEEGYEEYLSSLKSEEKKKQMTEKIKESFVDEPIELFEYESMSGEKIDMKELKGKVLVLDFWATWCGPCKAAMPGMNMAYQKYKEDENVKFFFISTMESDKDFKSKIKKFIDKKGYDFTVLYDAHNPKTDKGDLAYYTYSKAFGFSGIPQKMIIDGNGHLRWRSTGYYGSPSALADEISYVIEHVKK